MDDQRFRQRRHRRNAALRRCRFTAGWADNFSAPKKANGKRKSPIGVVALNKTNGSTNWIYEGAKNSITNMIVLPENNVLLIGDEKNLIGLDLIEPGQS